jgi:dienelactone hydrolase
VSQHFAPEAAPGLGDAGIPNHDPQVQIDSRRARVIVPSFFFYLSRSAVVLLALLAVVGCFRRSSQALETHREIELVTADSVRLASTLYPVAETKPPAIVFVHMLGSDRHAWEALATRAQQAGFLGLALDLRGHGESARQTPNAPDYHTFSDATWREALQDIAAAKRVLIEQGANPENIAVLGAGIGASLALHYSVEDLDVAAVILLSPSLEDHGFKTNDDLLAYGRRPVLLVCGEDDSSASAACAALKQTAPGFCELRSYAGSARGTDLLVSSPNAIEQVVQWLVPILKSTKPAVASPAA